LSIHELTDSPKGPELSMTLAITFLNSSTVREISFPLHVLEGEIEAKGE
jgi:hypothetical protein